MPTPAQQAAILKARESKNLSFEQMAALNRIRNKTGPNPSAANLAGEFASGFNRSVLGALDIVPKGINGALSLAGVDAQLPTFQGAADKIGVGAPAGTFAGPGLATDIASAAGETIPAALMAGQMIRSGAQQLSPLAAQSESAFNGVLRQAAQSTPAQDAGYGAISAAGSAVGKEYGGDAGGMVGAFLAPLSVAGSASVFKKIFSSPQSVNALAQSLNTMSDDGAAALLAEQMVREGVSPEDVAKQLAALGPNAIPADVNNSFARLLRAASNMIPRLQGHANQVLNARQAGQAGRLASSLDESLGVPGLSMDDEIARMHQATQPTINALYEQARQQPIAINVRLKTLLEGENSLGDAFKAAQRRVADKRAAGDTITHFDLIDATKQQLDDQIGVAIRAGENNRARDLVRLKNVLVSEADAQIPGYSQARQAFAGRAALENAADQGTLFFKLNPREIDAMTSGMGESELRMFRLGAKQALLDKMDTLPIGSDSVRRLFGKNGDSAKLRNLFPDEDAFNEFNSTLEREANFVMTRRAAQGNSTTVQQAVDARDARSVFTSARALLGDPAAAAQEFGRIVQGLASKKEAAAFQQALERAGDILLASGSDPAQLQRILQRGNAPRLKAMLEAVMIKPLPNSGRALTSAAITEGAQR